MWGWDRWLRRVMLMPPARSSFQPAQGGGVNHHLHAPSHNAPNHTFPQCAQSRLPTMHPSMQAGGSSLAFPSWMTEKGLVAWTVYAGGGGEFQHKPSPPPSQQVPTLIPPFCSPTALSQPLGNKDEAETVTSLQTKGCPPLSLLCRCYIPFRSFRLMKISLFVPLYFKSVFDFSVLKKHHICCQLLLSSDTCRSYTFRPLVLFFLWCMQHLNNSNTGGGETRRRTAWQNTSGPFWN